VVDVSTVIVVNKGLGREEWLRDNSVSVVGETGNDSKKEIILSD